MGNWRGAFSRAHLEVVTNILDPVHLLISCLGIKIKGALARGAVHPKPMLLIHLMRDKP